MHPAYQRKFRKLTGNPVRRAACAFDGCAAPPDVCVLPSGRVKSRSLCSAHYKQRERGQTLRPYTPRTDLAERWERWAELRSRDRRWLGITHAKCGGGMSVIASNPNGKRGVRYCYCAACGVRVVVERDGSQRAPRKVVRS